MKVFKTKIASQNCKNIHLIGIFKLVFNIGTRYLVFVCLFGPILYNTMSAYWKPERRILDFVSGFYITILLKLYDIVFVNE